MSKFVEAESTELLTFDESLESAGNVVCDVRLTVRVAEDESV